MVTESNIMIERKAIDTQYIRGESIRPPSVMACVGGGEEGASDNVVRAWNT